MPSSCQIYRCSYMYILFSYFTFFRSKTLWNKWRNWKLRWREQEIREWAGLAGTRNSGIPGTSAENFPYWNSFFKKTSCSFQTVYILLKLLGPIFWLLQCQIIFVHGDVDLLTRVIHKRPEYWSATNNDDSTVCSNILFKIVGEIEENAGRGSMFERKRRENEQVPCWDGWLCRESRKKLPKCGERNRDTR